MKAINLMLLTRVRDPETMSLLFQELAASRREKKISPHEAASMCALTDYLTRAASPSLRSSFEWMSLFDGFYFSYVIDHIGKEFDLLKISADGECALNIELKSEDIGEQRIKKQLEQNRYYLAHTSGTIFSFTYVMDTDTLYSLNDKGYLKVCAADDLIRALQRPALKDCLADGIDKFFRSSDYLISPVAAPEKFLQGQYFLTNQQSDFRRRILEHLKAASGVLHTGRHSDPGSVSAISAPVISVTGNAGTGKTLLLFDLAMKLSEKSKVLLIHSGPLRQGHIKIDRRLKNVDIRSINELISSSASIKQAELIRNTVPQLTDFLTDYTCLLIDEADHLETETLQQLTDSARTKQIPVILAYDPRQMLDELMPETSYAETIRLIEKISTLSLAFTGNIRINRPVYYFLRTLLNQKERSGHPDYSCINVIYAGNQDELNQIVRYHTNQGYKWIRTQAAKITEDLVIAQECEKVLIILDQDYYYDKDLHLRVQSGNESAIRLLYEGLSRTRDSLCLIISGCPELFRAILNIRLQK